MITHKSTFSKRAQSGVGSKGNHSGGVSFPPVINLLVIHVSLIDPVSQMCQYVYIVKRRAMSLQSFRNERRMPGPTLAIFWCSALDLSLKRNA